MIDVLFWGLVLGFGVLKEKKKGAGDEPAQNQVPPPPGGGRVDGWMGGRRSALVARFSSRADIYLIAKGSPRYPYTPFFPPTR